LSKPKSVKDTLPGDQFRHVDDSQSVDNLKPGLLLGILPSMGQEHLNQLDQIEQLDSQLLSDVQASGKVEEQFKKAIRTFSPCVPISLTKK
jgi:hypothetical protein